MNRLPLLLAAFWIVSCSGAQHAATSASPAPAKAALSEATAQRRAEEAANAPAHSHLLGIIKRKAIGPFGAKSGDAALVGWIAMADRGGNEELTVVPVGADEAPLAEPRVVASFAQEATLLVIRASGAERAGWLAAYSTLLDRGEALSVIGLAPDGTARGKPADLQRTSDHVKWVDLVPTSRGAVCIWAEETPTGDASILVAAVDPDGKPRGMPARLARGIVGWAAVKTGDGAGLALVNPSPVPPHADKDGPGSLSWLRLDIEGRPMGPPLAIGTKPTVTGDVDVAPTQGGFLLGWTDRTGEDAQVVLAFVDASGQVHGPKHAMEAVGGSKLVGLAASAESAALAWQEPRGRTRATHAVHLASVSTGAPSAQPMTSLQIAGTSVLEFASTEGGFALLAPAQACRQTDGPSECTSPVAPTYVRFDGRLAPVQTEPVLVGDTHAGAALGWCLQCAGDHCLALAASSESPTPIFSLDFAPRTSPFVPPAPAANPPNAPRLSGIATIASGQAYADVAAVRVGQAAFVAALTNVSGEMPDRSNRLRGATITLRRLDDGGQLLGSPTTVTSRALAIGGVALAPAGRPEDGAAVAWVARDDGDPQVHVARIDAAGKRHGEVQLTTAKGDASDLAMAWANDGWLIAWVDARDGNGEVYVVKVDRELSRVAREERITSAPGDAGDVALAIHGDKAWLAWSDPRESPKEGVADIYVTTLRTRDGKRTGDETRVIATAGHSRSPQLAASADGALVAWIEDAPGELEAPSAAMVARLDTEGHPVGVPTKVILAAEGRPTNIALQPFAHGVRAVIARTLANDVTLDGVVLSAEGIAIAPPAPIVDLDAPGSFDVALALAGDALFFDDVGATPREHRVRRASIAWGR